MDKNFLIEAQGLSFERSGRIIFSSVISSKALVASSKINIFGLLYRALAIAILCFCPPDKLFAFSSIL